MSEDRLYLYVPPEEKAEVEGLGGLWDAEAMCWYILSGNDATRFSKWLPDAPFDGEFTISSQQAYVAAASVPCPACGVTVEVICVYCESGTVLGEPLSQFTVSHIRAVDEALAQELSRWPTFREGFSEMEQDRVFANHCPRCGAMLEEMDLHSEPEQPFFSVAHAAPGAIRLTPVVGEVHLSGDESFEI